MTRVMTTILLGLGVLLLLPACEEEAPKLSRAQRKIVDSLVQVERVRIRPILDSLCDIRFDTELASKTDSIVQERMAEIKRKIEADANQN